MTSNKLKLHQKAIVDNLNLVNIVHDPEPIIFEKRIGTEKNDFYRGSSYFDDDTHQRYQSASANFEFIDVDKLSMYSYLVKREFQQKEWLSKYYQNEQNNSYKNDIKEEPVKIPKAVTKTESKKNVAFTGDNTIKNEQAKLINSKSSISTITSSSTTTNRVNNLNKPIMNKSDSEIADLVKCCDDSIKAIEFMEKQLNEFRNERLKIVFNNPSEEEKHKRIQLEQIKYLSRSTYNLQNQIAKFKSQFTHPQKTVSTKNSISPVSRLIHAMRQTIKQVHMFSSDLYPYRPDNDPISDKLYIHFYKQLNYLIANFNECIHAICLNNVIKLSDQFNATKSKSIADALVNLLSNCNKFFDELKEDKNETSSSTDINQRAVVNNKYLDSNVEKSNSSNVLNVIRVTRNDKKSIKKSLVMDKKRKQIEYRSEKAEKPLSARSDSSPSKVSSSEFLQKRVQTARLFPGKKVDTTNKIPRKSILNNRKIPLKSIENHKDTIDVSKMSNNWYSMEDLQNVKRLNDMNLLDEDKAPVAFEHLSSPKIKRQSLRTRSDEKIHSKIASRSVSNENFQSRSRSNSSIRNHNQKFKDSSSSLNESKSPGPKSIYLPNYSDTSQIDDLNVSIDLEEMKLKYGNDINQVKARFNQTHHDNFRVNKEFATNLYKKQYNKPIDPNSTASLPQTTRQFISRLDLIKKDNDEIRKKYQNLNYEYQANILNEKPRRRYEELYLQNVEPLKIDYESKIDFNKVYKPLKPPSVEQLKRVIDYSNKFKDFIEKTSITTIGESKFDDFELFEMLSDGLYENYFNSVYQELESLNDELSTNLINAEFHLSNTNHSVVPSPRIQQSKNLSTKSQTMFNDKNNSTLQSHHTSISIHTVVNELDNQDNNDDNYNNNNNINNVPYNQFNTSYSSFKTNQDEESSSVTSLSN